MPCGIAALRLSQRGLIPRVTFQQAEAEGCPRRAGKNKWQSDEEHSLLSSLGCNPTRLLCELTCRFRADRLPQLFAIRAKQKICRTERQHQK